MNASLSRTQPRIVLRLDLPEANWSRMFTQGICQKAIAVVVAAVAAAAMLGFGTVKFGSVSLPVAASLVVLLAAISCAVLTALLRPLLVWEQRLATVQSADFSPLHLPMATGSRPADIGWNLLISQGQKWQALSELEHSLNQTLVANHSSASDRLLDALPDGVAEVDESGQILFANRVLAAICGTESAQLLSGKTLAGALQVDDETAARFVDACGGLLHVVEWTMPGTGDATRTLRAFRRPTSTEGSHRTFVWTIRDISQLRLAEAMRDRFLSTATHEFRTPLANIRAYAESLEMGHDIDTEHRKRFYNVIQSESMRLSQLVDDLLDISRMQAGALALDCRETDVGRLVEEAATKVAAQMREKNLQFRCELPPKFPKVAVDKSKLTAALINLLGNAAKYTPEGGRVTFRVDVDADALEFSVTDTGIGISAEELPRVFDRFFRSNDERVRSITGSGLGLALSQEIARLHGGGISVESTPNKGSTFRMSLPLDSAA